MASAIIHMCVAKKVNSYLQMDERMLTLGAIAPDISKQIGRDKIESHFLNKEDAETGIPNCDRFVKKYRSELNKPFEMGYLIHLLTDKYWFRDYMPKFIKDFTDDKDATYEALRTIIYGDYTCLNRRLIDDYMLDLYFFSNDFVYPQSKITEIPIDKLPIIVEKMGIIISKSYSKKLVMMNEDEIIDFIEHIGNQIVDDLKDYKLIK
jgi:hypothetical protein